ncbi:hypothetical protein GCM10011608_58590 [Micromonospora sonchi]|uniref:Uncharacterized protein n=1 Tax=Micromonospora sonchi TaxID=1763543 RepID=A0A917U8D4_9ACTN|nr:hypothetical protein [Micromonospora sonchi]GGM65636.1 hypothetical protein GCM10011608_58590 [Micromonospora sonchi]
MTEPSQLMPPDQPEVVPNIDAGPVPDSMPTTRRHTYLIAAAGVAVLIAAIGISLLLSGAGHDEPGAEQPTRTAIEAAHARCGPSGTEYARVGDGGRTLTLNSHGKKSSGLAYAQLECYWTMLEMPDSVRAEVEATRALDGRRSGEWDGIRVSWSYHPDSGVQMVFTLAD